MICAQAYKILAFFGASLSVSPYLLLYPSLLPDLPPPLGFPAGASKWTADSPGC